MILFIRIRRRRTELGRHCLRMHSAPKSLLSPTTAQRLSPKNNGFRGKLGTTNPQFCLDRFTRTAPRAGRIGIRHRSIPNDHEWNGKISNKGFKNLHFSRKNKLFCRKAIWCRTRRTTPVSIECHDAVTEIRRHRTTSGTVHRRSRGEEKSTFSAENPRLWALNPWKQSTRISPITANRDSL